MRKPTGHCYPGCLVCRPMPDPTEIAAEIMRRTLSGMDRWREREASRLRRLYPQPSPLQQLVEEIKAARASR